MLLSRWVKLGSGGATVRTLVVSLVIAITMLVVAPSLATALAQQPPLPSVFGGTAILDGATAADGTEVSAWIDGAKVATTTVNPNGNNPGNYALKIPQPPDRSYNGQEVAFRIRDFTTAEIGTWESSGGGILNLTASSAPPDPTSAHGLPQASGKRCILRQGVRIRLFPVRPVITTESDGLIDTVLDNPPANECNLNGELLLYVPPGMLVYDQRGVTVSRAGRAKLLFNDPSDPLMPGDERGFMIGFKSNKIGEYNIDLEVTSWPVGDKARFKVSTAHQTIRVESISDLDEPPIPMTKTSTITPTKAPIVTPPGEKSFWTEPWGIIILVIVLVVVAMVAMVALVAARK